NALHTKRQNLFQELDAVIHLLMEAKHWGLRKSRNATSLNSRFKSLDTLKVKIISVTFRRVIRTNHKKASKIWRHENIQLGGCQSLRLFPRQIRANTISFTVFPEIVPSIGNSFINTMKNINHTRSSISDDIRNILCSSRSEERFSRNAETDLVCRLLLEKKKKTIMYTFTRPLIFYFFFNHTPTTDIYTLSLHDALPIYFLDKLEPIPSALPSFQKLFQVSATALSIPWKISTTPEAASVTTLEISFAVAPI